MSFMQHRHHPEPVRYAYERAIFNEISMLLDYVAGCPNKTLRDLSVLDATKSNTIVPVAEVLSRLTAIESGLIARPAPALKGDDSSFLLLVRDALNALIRPASGLTVAYTAMVVGNRRGEAVKSRAVLAEQAYAGLSWSAKTHRWGQNLLLAFALLATIAAAWDSAKVALGKSVLHNLIDLRVKQADITREMVRLEEALSQPNAPAFPLFQLAGDGADGAGRLRLTVRLCERPTIIRSFLAASPPSQLTRMAIPVSADVFETAAQQDVCDRNRLLGDSFYLAHKAIYAYMTDWPAVAGTGFDMVAQLARIGIGFGQGLCDALRLGSCASHPNPLIALADDRDHADSELLLAPVLIVLGNYALPMIFAVLGAAAFVILDYYGKLRDSLLAPRDHILSWIRLVLGSVIGACIGLVFSSYGPQSPGPQADLIGALTLSASGVGFLAGFGVEGVFAMLDTVVKRVFGGQPASSL